MYTALGWVIDGVTLNNQNVHVISGNWHNYKQNLLKK